MWQPSRREFLQSSALAAAGLAVAGYDAPLAAQIKGDRPKQSDGVAVLNPRGRVPVSLIIDDSTCLVNLAHFCIPHFAEAFPDQYKQDWRKLPRGIPDAFVRKFGEWCRDHGVKGKYSVIPYPACVGWLDRDIPGWSKRELDDSLKLVREFMMPNWDIHPEMVTHTWVIDVKTGRPYPDRNEKFLENWRWTDGKSADQLAEYIAFALRVLKNAGLTCEGMTTPGGFGNRVLPALAQGTLQACRDVFRTEIPHYFRHLFIDDRSVAPRVEHASGLTGDDPKCVVSIVGCTSDWFGGWDGLSPGSADLMVSRDLKSGRLIDVIGRGEPAVLVCHWPGIYYNGDEIGFGIFKEVVKRLEARYDNLLWMKLSEIARYWAAKELTQIDRRDGHVTLTAPFASPRFTIRVAKAGPGEPTLTAGDRPVMLKEVKRPLDLDNGTWRRDEDGTTVCFDLPKGKTTLAV